MPTLTLPLSLESYRKLATAFVRLTKEERNYEDFNYEEILKMRKSYKYKTPRKNRKNVDEAFEAKHKIDCEQTVAKIDALLARFPTKKHYIVCKYAPLEYDMEFIIAVEDQKQAYEYRTYLCMQEALMAAADQ